MSFTNAYSAYRDTAVKTASQGRLVVLLYQGAVKELSAAQNCFEADGSMAARNIEAYGKHIAKAQEIINELQTSLDMEAGGQVAQNLMGLYVYFNHELLDASINKNKKKLEFVRGMLDQLSSAWETAARTTETSQPVRPTLNITG